MAPLLEFGVFAVNIVGKFSYSRGPATFCVYLQTTTIVSKNIRTPDNSLIKSMLAVQSVRWWW